MKAISIGKGLIAATLLSFAGGTLLHEAAYAQATQTVPATTPAATATGASTTPTAGPTATPATTAEAGKAIAAPATPPQAPVTTPAGVAAAKDASGPAVAPKGSYTPLKPEAGIGQPVQGGLGLQPVVTEVGRDGRWLHDGPLMWIVVIVSALVLLLLAYTMFRFREGANPTPSKTSHNTLIEVLWTGIPALILIAVAVPSIKLVAKQYTPAPKDAVTIKVTGYQWNWGYAYPDHGIAEYISKMLPEAEAAKRGEPAQLAVDERMVVPVGKTVKLIVTGADVIHSWAVPALWSKIDAVPGRNNEITFKADRVGVYYGQCSELCGVDHGFMPIAVEVLPQDKFDQWVLFKGGKLPGREPAPTAAPAATPAAAAAPAPAPTPPAAGAPAAGTPAAPSPAAAAAATPAKAN